MTRRMFGCEKFRLANLDEGFQLAVHFLFDNDQHATHRCAVWPNEAGFYP